MKMIRESKTAQKDRWYFWIVLLSFVIVFCNLFRIFDQNFWGDETYTIRMSGMSLSAMVKETAADVHPPFYYMIVQVFRRLFGNEGAVYHLASFLAYVLSIVTALTGIRKRFGTEAALIFVLLASFLDTSITYNVEVRMYSWGALFLLSAFLALYDIMQENRKKDYIAFTLFALAGAYTHYYCLISVAFFYVALIVWAFVKKGTYFKRTAITCIVTVVLYLPWFIVLLQTFGRTVGGDFWMSYIPYLKDCLFYLFESRISGVLFAAMLFFTAAAIWIGYTCRETEKLVWLLAGLSSVFGTILVGNVVSKVFKPVLILRYLYPVSVVAWVLLAVGVAACRKKRVYALVLSVMLLSVGVPSFWKVFREERWQNERLLYTLEATREAVGAGNVLLTDLQYLEWTVAEYYYPETECMLIEPDRLPKLEPDRQYWLMVQGDAGEQTLNGLKQQGYLVDKVAEDGILGTNPVTVYRIYGGQ